MRTMIKRMPQAELLRELKDDLNKNTTEAIAYFDQMYTQAKLQLEILIRVKEKYFVY